MLGPLLAQKMTSHSTAAPMPSHYLSRAMHVSTSGRSAACSALHAGQPHGDVAGSPHGHSAQEALVGAAETVQTLVVRGHAHLALEEPVSLHSTQQAEPPDIHGGSSDGSWQPPSASAAVSGWAADMWQAQKVAGQHAMITVRAWQAQLTTSSMSASCEAVRCVILAGSASPGATSLYACRSASL